MHTFDLFYTFVSNYFRQCNPLDNHVCSYPEFYVTTGAPASTLRTTCNFIPQKLIYDRPLQTLGVRTVFNELMESAMFTATFNLVTLITVIFGALKGGSLLINSLASNNRFSKKNFFQNGFNALFKNSWRLFEKKNRNKTKQKQTKTTKKKNPLNFTTWFGSSHNVKIFHQPVALILIKELQMIFQTIDVSIWNHSIKTPYRNINFLYLILHSSSSMFPLLLLTLEV